MSGKICMLQKEQLRGASEELVKAVETIIENMKNIASLIFEVSESSSALAGDACGAGASFLAGIEQGILSIQAAFSGYSQAKDELAAAITSAGSALSEMRGYTEEIQAIGSKMKLIGLNAVVKASHMKEEGTALGVVAEALHHLSKESVKRIESVYEVLSGITATAETIKGEAGAAGAESAFDLESMANELKKRISGLQKAGERAFALLEGANSEGQALSGEIRTTVSNIKVHRKIAKYINSTIAGLEEITALYSRDLSDQAVSGAEGYLESLEDSYTMQAQRQVHQAVMEDAPHNGGDRKTGSSKQESLSGFEDREICLPAISDLESQANLSSQEGNGQFENEEREFGDNVELF
jgi:hypothetical protein